MSKGIKNWREYENPLATSETVARAETVLAAHGIGKLDQTRNQKPTPPPVIRAILRDVRKANVESEQ